ncbi:hypothetical protein AB0M50_23635 [Nonomuraea fuscirosea]|jgi:hypothetical protein|uniref:hypothetical protein n=1 Tax=Nonomuraea fuscirosea TaxID=1291556 RepID=UPI002DDB21F6|nr:hypothetical protein [Nonomuraea fuscirosea]WSA48641.1 hypothetical protein OIE67_31725 [Nonomuraea fuscirosea]
MTAVELIVAALTAGASAGVTASASTAVQDAYAGLRDAVRRRLAGDQDALAELDQDAQDRPDGPERLTAALEAAGADRDPEILQAARDLLALVRAPHAGPRPTVVLHEAKGVQIGDGNTQTNTFT